MSGNQHGINGCHTSRRISRSGNFEAKKCVHMTKSLLAGEAKVRTKPLRRDKAVGICLSSHTCSNGSQQTEKPQNTCMTKHKHSRNFADTKGCDDCPTLFERRCSYTSIDSRHRHTGVLSHTKVHLLTRSRTVSEGYDHITTSSAESGRRNSYGSIMPGKGASADREFIPKRGASYKGYEKLIDSYDSRPCSPLASNLHMIIANAKCEDDGGDMESNDDVDLESNDDVDVEINDVNINIISNTNTPWWRILLEVVIPFFCAGFGLTFAGELLATVEVCTFLRVLSLIKSGMYYFLSR